MSTPSRPDPREQRRHPRIDVSLPVRFTGDGERFHDGVATSLSAGGVFVQTVASVELRTEVWLDLGLGEPVGRLQASAKVVNLDRRIGRAVIRGFGAQFLEPPADLAARLERFERHHPGRVLLEPDGTLRWPIHLGGDHEPSRDSGKGVRLLVAGRWVRDPGLPDEDTESVALGRSPAEYADLLGGILETLRAGEVRDAVLSFHGRALSPQDGVPGDELRAELERRRLGGGPPEGWLAVLAAQMRVVDDLAMSAWRIEEMWPEQIEALERTPVSLERARASLGALAGGDDGDAASPREQALAGLDALERFVERLRFAAATLVPADATPQAFLEWRRARQPARRAPALRRAQHGTRPLRRPAGAAPRAPSTPEWRSIVLGALLVALLAATAVYGYRRTLRLLSPPTVPLHAVTIEELARSLPVESHRVEGETLVLTVPDEWARQPTQRIAADFTSLVSELAVLGYSSVVLERADGVLVALWRDGTVRVLR